MPSERSAAESIRTMLEEAGLQHSAPLETALRELAVQPSVVPEPSPELAALLAGAAPIRKRTRRRRATLAAVSIAGAVALGAGAAAAANPGMRQTWTEFFMTVTTPGEQVPGPADSPGSTGAVDLPKPAAARTQTAAGPDGPKGGHDARSGNDRRRVPGTDRRRGAVDAEPGPEAGHEAGRTAEGTAEGRVEREAGHEVEPRVEHKAERAVEREAEDEVEREVEREAEDEGGREVEREAEDEAGREVEREVEREAEDEAGRQARRSRETEAEPDTRREAETEQDDTSRSAEEEHGDAGPDRTEPAEETRDEHGGGDDED
ncbi:hypothetical protein [Arthrobacter mobilis]|uniref:Uncharacterized protein n=1 Tax=Arthrobacter mobilis TaxID=2724944 RepID=A0A7X6HAQ0_9MICC|nr:hypothetical protein [Arthrobacter mobilis]NKX53145.1 hypothetical protein [Arthrobacter mobilis]